MKLAFRIAGRFLASAKGQTILIILGIAVGVSVQVFIGSLITGLQKSLLNTTIGRSSQITVRPAERGALLADYRGIENQIMTAEPGVKSLTAVADASGFVRVGKDSYPVLVRGLDFSSAEGIYRIKEALTDGKLPGAGEILLGRELMQEAGLKTGDSVEILTPAGVPTRVTVAGVYDLKVTSLNKSWAIAEMPLVQNIFGYGDTATAVEMQLRDVFAADSVAQAISSRLGSACKTENWKEANASLLSGLNGQSVSSLMIQVFVLVSVVLGIASVLAISVLQKSRQIGILKAMGIRNGTASLIFLFQGLILGVLGALLGVAFGLGLGAAFTRFALNPDGTPVVPLTIDPKFIGISALIAVAAAVAAALIPARRSSRLDPIEVIRNG